MRYKQSFCYLNILASALSLFCAPATLQRSPRQHLRHGAASLQTLRLSAPASNKPHSAENNTPVWLAIWRIWTGFANSQLRRAAFRITYLHICAHPHCSYVGLLLRHSKSFDPSAPIAYATSVSPPYEAAAWLGRRCLGLDMAVACAGVKVLGGK